MATADQTNSFCTSTEAEAYFETRLHADAWDSAVANDKEKALIQATRMFMQYFIWVAGLPEIINTPQTVKDACCEMALVLLAEDKQAASDLDGIAKLQVDGVMSIEVAGSKAMFPEHVRALLGNMVVFPCGTVPILRG